MPLSNEFRESMFCENIILQIFTLNVNLKTHHPDTTPVYKLILNYTFPEKIFRGRRKRTNFDSFIWHNWVSYLKNCVKKGLKFLSKVFAYRKCVRNLQVCLMYLVIRSTLRLSLFHPPKNFLYLLYRKSKKESPKKFILFKSR